MLLGICIIYPLFLAFSRREKGFSFALDSQFLSPRLLFVYGRPTSTLLVLIQELAL